MKTIKFIAFWMLSFLSTDAQDLWTQRADFGGGIRYAAAAFSVGNYGYAGLGVDDSGNYYADLWQFDPSNNTWSQKADFPGGARFGATGFSYAGKGYIGWGANTPGDYGWLWYKDIWQYDPASNSWTQKQDFGSAEEKGRYFMVAFTIGDKVYAGTGSYRRDRDDIAHYKNDFWQYDPVNDTWTRKADVPEEGRFAATGMSIGDKGYIGTGFYYYDTRKKDFWEYDPATDVWTRKADLPGTERYGATAFSIGNRGYICSGWNYSGLNDLWEYNPFTDSWIPRAAIPGSVRHLGISMVINNKGYTGLGSSSISSLQDLWEYTPPSQCDSPFSVTIPDVYAIRQGAAANTLYIGYGPSSLTLKASVQGGKAQPDNEFAYRWSDGSTGSSTTFNLSAAGTYPYSVVVTDSYGCVDSASTSIKVLDIRCGINGNMVAICQRAVGRYGKEKTICVSREAVPQMLKTGASLGECSSDPCHEIPDVRDHDDLLVYPNPNKGVFNVKVKGERWYTFLRVLDPNGRIVAIKALSEVKGTQTVQIDLGKVPAGIYTIQAVGKNMITTIKMIVSR